MPVAYVASYLILLDPSPQFVEPEKGMYVLRNVEFRIGGELSIAVFRPLMELDWRLRPKYWMDATEKGKHWE